MTALKIFIVEDSALIRENLIAALEEMAPAEVMACAAGEASAIAWLRERGPECDLVIIDIFLREGSGLAVLRALRDAGARCKRVVLTNFATDEMRRVCLSIGADRVYDKSGEIEDLIDYCASLAAPARPGAAADGERNAAPLAH